jgi:hypothetical protein
MDSGGGRSCVDDKSAAKLGLKWKRATGREYGTYLGVGGQETPYLGVTDVVRI